jgi:hypothetical protein
MLNRKWQRMFAVSLFAFITLWPVRAAWAADVAPLPASSTCLQQAKDTLGTVLPGSYTYLECARRGLAANGLVPVTGEVNGSSLWQDLGTTYIHPNDWHDAGASGGRAIEGGWRDAGAGSR